jgi:hypothetical protein
MTTGLEVQQRLFLNVWRGTDTTVRIQVFQTAAGQVTTPQTMTGWALSFTVREKATDSAASMTKTPSLANGDVTQGEQSGTNSVAVIAIEDSDTTGLTAGTFACDLKRTDSGSEAILAMGAFELLQEVTR